MGKHCGNPQMHCMTETTPRSSGKMVMREHTIYTDPPGSLPPFKNPVSCFSGEGGNQSPTPPGTLWDPKENCKEKSDVKKVAKNTAPEPGKLCFFLGGGRTITLKKKTSHLGGGAFSNCMFSHRLKKKCHRPRSHHGPSETRHLGPC